MPSSNHSSQGREGSSDTDRSDAGNGKKSRKGKARATTMELREEAAQRFYEEREQRRVRLISAYQEQAEEAAQRAEVANEEAARALQLIRDLEALDAEAPEFDELPVIETLKSVSPERAEGGGEVDGLNNEDDSDVEQEGENVCDSCRKSGQICVVEVGRTACRWYRDKHVQCSRARPLGPPRVNKRRAAQEARRQGSAPVAGPSQTRRNAGTERGDRSDHEVRDRTRKELERRARKAEGKEGVRGKLRELEAHVGYLGEQAGHTMLRYKLAYRACQLILKTLAAPESGREVPSGVERMLRWMAADMEASKWDFSLAEEAELDLVAEEPEEDEDAPPAKRRRLMKRGSPEVEEKEVEPVESQDSEAEPEDFRSTDGGEDMRMEVDAPGALEGPEGPEEEQVAATSRVASQVAEARTVTVLTFKPDPEPVPPPPPTPSPAPEPLVQVKRESEVHEFQTLVLQPGAPAGFHEEDGVFVMDDSDEGMGEPEAPEKPQASGSAE
ncbi:hypothetical protein DFH07DRAFT_972501 [Mycena maculata]|uniref:Uncharacterized protein n=1 Tax=Mycena maculata TaxID=230809 RepID=A0AAD7HHA6_9AGAR|nr:hypothetical protein DFH07DRAFT_972501 [Mycena maculata]